MNKGVLLIVSGPSGAGKGTVCSEYMKRRPETFLSISATSRSPRPGDEDGVTYFFKTREQFEKMIEDDGFLEYAEFCGNYYGTPKEPAITAIKNGRDVILEIEVQGAEKVMKHCTDFVSVFLTVPSIGELEKRLRGRGTESEERITARMNAAIYELSHAGNYQYLVLNDEIPLAVERLNTIIEAEKMRFSRN